MHQYLGAGLLHRLHPTRRGCGFLQYGGDSVQDTPVVYLALERGYRAVVHNDVHIGGYFGGVESTKRCHCCYSVREHQPAGRNLVFLRCQGQCADGNIHPNQSKQDPFSFSLCFPPSNPTNLIILDGASSDCPATGVKYLPKSGSGTSPTTTTTSAGTGPTTAPGTPFSGKGTLQVTPSGSSSPDGCIISAGTWYIGGTCATFTATPSGSGFTLASSKGRCAIQSSNLVCASSVTTATVFTNVGNELEFNASPAFYASAVPSGTAQATVSTAMLAKGLVITWVSA